MYKKQFAGEGDKRTKFRRSHTNDFENLRVFFDYTYTLNHEKIMISELIMPSVKKFLESTLSVRRFPGKIRFPKTAELCGELPIPQKYYKKGVNADLIIFVSTYKGVKKYNEMLKTTGHRNNTQKNQTQSSKNVIKHNLVSSSVNKNLSKSVKESADQIISSIEKSLDNIDNDPLFRKVNPKKSFREIEPLNLYLDEYNKMKKQISNKSTINTSSKRISESNNNSSVNIFANTPLDPEEMSGVVGYSMQCLQDIYTLRPLAGQMHYVARINPNQRSVEEAIWTTIHEITHILAMDYELYSDYIDQDFNRRGYENTILIKTKFKDLDVYVNKTKNLTLWIDNNGTITTNWNISHKMHNYNTGNVYSHTQEENSNKTKAAKNSTKKKKKEIFTELETVKEFTYFNFTNDLNITLLIFTIENFFENVKFYLKTPKLVQAAKTYYNCDTIKGVELEHFGGPGSAFSHWSKRALNTEYMIADSYGENYVSNITLSLMEDTGWYRVNYDNAQSILWGRDKGCEFLENKCIMKSDKKVSFLSDRTNLRVGNQLKTQQFREFNMVSTNYFTKFPEYCTNFNKDTCSLSKIFRGTCYISNYTQSLPKDFQYFEDPRIGGSTQFGDYCTYPLEWMDPASGLPFGSCRNGVQFYPSLGEKICENCRCFMSTLVPTKVKNDYTEKARSVCYEAKCKRVKSKLILTILINDQEIICPEKGGILSVDDFDGFIECPKSRDVCTGDLAPNDGLKQEFSFFHGLCEKLLKIVLEFIDWIYKKDK